MPFRLRLSQENYPSSGHKTTHHCNTQCSHAAVQVSEQDRVIKQLQTDNAELDAKLNYPRSDIACQVFGPQLVSSSVQATAMVITIGTSTADLEHVSRVSVEVQTEAAYEAPAGIMDHHTAR